MKTGRRAASRRSGRRAARRGRSRPASRSGTSPIDGYSASHFYKGVRRRSSLPAACTACCRVGRSRRAPTVPTSSIRRGGPASGSCAAGRTTWTGPIPDDTLVLGSWACRVPRASVNEWLLSWAACLFVPRWRTGCVCCLLRAACDRGLPRFLLKRFSRPCSPFTTALDGARSRSPVSRTSGVVFFASSFLRLHTHRYRRRGEWFELGDVRTSFV